MRAFMIALLCVAASASTMALAPAWAADTLARARETGTLRLGFRADAPPYSYRGVDGTPSGYIVDLCREVASGVEKSLKVQPLKIEYVEVSSTTRLTSLRDGKIDILCDPTSMTMSRRTMVDFSLPTFIDGAGVLHRVNEFYRLEDLRGKKIGVLQGTTTEEVLKGTLGQFGIKAEIVPVQAHPDGVRSLSAGRIDAYFADRGILNYHLLNGRHATALKLSDQYYTFETYALALPRGDDKLRLLVDATLAELYRTDRVKTIYARNFGSFPPDQFIRALFVINGVPK
ncbi:amino acid ABC transporter substrate-binding protein [Enterovirga rhinocerotis]|uniref:Amino acid ABC transporter substrate-binding protein (PAAT family) n=1 Tax=Enterovirga rhinocerotis TaxID=1339210 RepID=A0A4R7C0U2_9HYPH|nr:amino acid ABC transporter substrate-binding protein [Enterovirga rhinocerotis]TDR89996.1 amino acid ABC transporter substrate-binding protein (PAAT family) [Enterovirga rhinocerotis]